MDRIRSGLGLILLLVLASLQSQVSAGSATQNDWSGGSAVPGPVTSWGNSFSSYSNIEYSIPSQLSIMQFFIEHSISQVDDETTMLSYLEDINGDGFTDVISSNIPNWKFIWWENTDGTGTIWTEHIIDPDFGGVAGVYASDINNDGFMDVITATYWSPGTITWWENKDGTGTSWTKHTINDDFSGAACVVAEDMNGDGRIDVVGAALYGNRITWWENVDGSGASWTEHNVAPFFDGATSVCIVDINNDGFFDVLGAAEDADDVTWWENVNGSGTSWTEHLVDGNVNGVKSVTFGDFNADSNIDIAAAAAYSDDVICWENVDGTGTNWVKHPVDEWYEYPSCIYAEDINQDGLSDLVTTSISVNFPKITYWENSDTSPGTCWLEHSIITYGTIYQTLDVGDIDGDGNFDLTASSQFGQCAWWSLVRNGFLLSSILDVQEKPEWQTIDWDCVEPAGTDIAFQVRASDDPAEMGPWSDTLSDPGSLSGIISNGDSLFQYKAIFLSTIPFVSPLLNSVTVEWTDMTGIQDEPSLGMVCYSLSGVCPNPVRRFSNIVFSVPAVSTVELTVFDLLGRVVSSSNDEYQPGKQEVVMTDLTPGLYFVRMVSDEYSAAQQFVVIK